MRTIKRRDVLAGGATAALGTLARPALAQSKPEKLVMLCVVGPWADTLYKQVIPAWREQTGINVEVSLLPADGLAIRLRAELVSRSGGVDLSMWNPPWAGWLAPHMADHDKLLAKFGSKPEDTDWKDIYKPAMEMASFRGKKIGLPYRVVAHVLYHQPALLQGLGITKAPETWPELTDAAKRITAGGGGKRYGIGYQGKVSVYAVGSFEPYLYSNGGDFYDPKTFDVLINNDAGVKALQYYADLLTVDKVVPPEVVTWNVDEIIAGAQTDRFGMTMVIGPWATQINGDGKTTTGKWATEGKWAYGLVPGATSPSQGRSSIGGWSIGVPDSSQNQAWAFQFLQYAMSKKWLLKSIETGNMPPTAALETDTEMAKNYPWAGATARSLRTAVLEPRDDVWPQLNARLAVGISEVLSGQKTAKVSLDSVASDWERQLKRAKLK